MPEIWNKYMHISEGVLSVPVLIVGGICTVGGVALGLKQIDYEDIPEIAVLSSAFFVASLVHIPYGVSSVHLVLNGLLGILLGWKVFPSILVALFLQALLFQFGGLTTLGVNTLNMAFPAVISFYLFSTFVRRGKKWGIIVAGVGAGILSILIASLFMALELFITEGNLLNVAKVVFLSHLPLMAIEGIITTFCLLFIKRVSPGILELNR